MDKNDVIYNFEPLWGSWKIDSCIGMGSSGKVYKIVKEDYNNKYYSAVKFMCLPSEAEYNYILSSLGNHEDTIANYWEDYIKDISKEISLLYNLKGHSNIISYEDHQIERIRNKNKWYIFIRMEYAIPLNDYVNDKKMTQKDVLKLGIDICTALELCHAKNIIHRDIKEANIFVSANNTYKLGDFSVSKDISNATHAGTKVGTLNYMPPEIMFCKEYGNNVDIYSLGLVLYKLLNNGRMPFLPKYPEKVTLKDLEIANMKRLTSGIFEPLDNVNGFLNEVIKKACSKEPKDRYQSATEFKEDLKIAVSNLSLNSTWQNRSYLAGNDISDNGTKTIHKNFVGEENINTADGTVRLFGKTKDYEKEFNDSKRISKKAMGIIIATAVIFILGLLVIVLIYNDDKGNDYVTNSPMVSDTNIKNNKIAEINDVRTSNIIKKESPKTSTTLTPKKEESSESSSNSTKPEETKKKATTSPIATVKNNGPANMLKNSGAELENDNWRMEYSGSSAGAHSYATDAKHSGSRSFRIDKTNELNCHFFRQNVPIGTGGTFKYSVYIKTVNISSKGCGIWVDYYKNNDSTISSDYVSIKQGLITGTSEWQYVTATVSVPENITYVNLILGTYGIGTVYYDDLTFVRQ